MFEYIKNTQIISIFYLLNFDLAVLIRKLKDINVIKTNQLNGAWLAILIKCNTKTTLYQNWLRCFNF